MTDVISVQLWTGAPMNVEISDMDGKICVKRSSKISPNAVSGHIQSLCNNGSLCPFNAFPDHRAKLPPI